MGSIANFTDLLFDLRAYSIVTLAVHESLEDALRTKVGITCGMHRDENLVLPMPLLQLHRR